MGEPGGTGVAALTSDLMDRSRLAAAFPGLVVTQEVDDCRGAAVVLVDLARHAGRVADLRRVAPGALVVAYGSHTDTTGLERARTEGADAAIPRSRLFRDPAAVVAGLRKGTEPDDSRG
jgi:hypothetical protein